MAAPSAGNILAALGMLGAMAGTYATLAADNSRTKEKVEQLEKQRVDDRRESKVDLKEVKQDVKNISSDMQTVLRKLDAAEARDRQRESDYVRRGR